MRQLLLRRRRRRVAAAARLSGAWSGLAADMTSLQLFQFIVSDNLCLGLIFSMILHNACLRVEGGLLSML